jgi:hypothetical protein
VPRLDRILLCWCDSPSRDALEYGEQAIYIFDFQTAEAIQTPMVAECADPQGAVDARPSIERSHFYSHGDGFAVRSRP